MRSGSKGLGSRLGCSPLRCGQRSAADSVSCGAFWTARCGCRVQNSVRRAGLCHGEAERLAGHGRRRSRVCRRGAGGLFPRGVVPAAAATDRFGAVVIYADLNGDGYGDLWSARLPVPVPRIPAGCTC